jgi:hypothetical protein
MLPALIKNLTALGEQFQLPSDWLVERPYLFSPAIVPVSAAHAHCMQDAVHAITYITRLPAFQAQLLQTADPIAQPNPGNLGVLFGYDFHLTPEGPKLIEINTNAGGAFMLALLEAAHGVENALETWQLNLMAMFLQEWQSIHPHQPLQHIAIVDDMPAQQYFYPEFLLFQHLFRAHHLRCNIVDTRDVHSVENKLYVFDTPQKEDKTAIDLVYNRATDFTFSQPEHAALRRAYQENHAVFTPHPHAYALYADKRHLALLSQSHFLHDAGVDAKTAALLQSVIPAAYLVDAENAQAVWDTRKQYFFKPLNSYGSKGVYKGRTITKQVFADILAGAYLAQRHVPPSEIRLDEHTKYKCDIRAYVYAGEILGFGARVYQGQMTNFRTPGSGFAMVKIMP